MYGLRLYHIISAIPLIFAASDLLWAEDNVPLLRYGFAAGKQYAFQVKIQAEAEKYDEVREGVLTYTVTSAKEKEFVLKPSGTLPVQIKPHANEIIIPRGPLGLMGPRGFRGPGFQEGITFNRQGEKIVSRELTPLPYLLGDMELLVIEEFPVEAKSSWEKQKEVEIVERDSGGPFPRFAFGGTRMAEGKHTTAKEQINYAVLKNDKDAIEISKKYSLLASPVADNPNRFEMTGEGQFTFDLTEGVIKSFSMKYECRENEKNVIRKYPIALTYRLLSPEELAEQKKKAEEARAAAAKAAEPKNFDPGERGRLLRELKSTDTNRIKTAADRLAKAPVDDHPADISKALAILLRNSDEGVQQSAVKALVVWATPEAENALIKASQSENVFLRNPAIEALGNLKSAKAAEAVAAQMYRQNSRREASKALKAMGPIAEDATIDCLNDRDMWVRAESCLVLQEIGGKKSLQALRDMSLKLAGNAPREASKAISAIELRLESEPDTAVSEGAKAKPADSASSTPAESSAGLRTWHDASGTFSVEAVMLSQQDGNVVLQKKDGKTVRVVIEKLSPADKKYVAEHAGDTPSKAENPFQ
ncbi:MAG: SHD1 domain-containing protein [Thermoguttaceae bacterium]|jgi:hypothetical protein